MFLTRTPTVFNRLHVLGLSKLFNKMPATGERMVELHENFTHHLDHLVRRCVACIGGRLPIKEPSNYIYAQGSHALLSIGSIHDFVAGLLQLALQIG